MLLAIGVPGWNVSGCAVSSAGLIEGEPEVAATTAMAMITIAIPPIMRCLEFKNQLAIARTILKLTVP